MSFIWHLLPIDSGIPKEQYEAELIQGESHKLSPKAGLAEHYLFSELKSISLWFLVWWEMKWSTNRTEWEKNKRKRTGLTNNFSNFILQPWARLWTTILAKVLVFRDYFKVKAIIRYWDHTTEVSMVYVNKRDALPATSIANENKNHV